MSKLFHTFLGLSLIIFAGMADLLFLGAVAFLIAGKFSVVGWVVGAVALYLWITSPLKPFLALKPSTIKKFWRNWNS